MDLLHLTTGTQWQGRPQRTPAATHTCRRQSWCRCTTPRHHNRPRSLLRNQPTWPTTSTSNHQLRRHHHSPFTLKVIIVFTCCQKSSLVNIHWNSFLQMQQFVRMAHKWLVDVLVYAHIHRIDHSILVFLSCIFSQISLITSFALILLLLFNFKFGVLAGIFKALYIEESETALSTEPLTKP